TSSTPRSWPPCATATRPPAPGSAPGPSCAAPPRTPSPTCWPPVRSRADEPARRPSRARGRPPHRSGAAAAGRHGARLGAGLPAARGLLLADAHPGRRGAGDLRERGAEHRDAPPDAGAARPGRRAAGAAARGRDGAGAGQLAGRAARRDRRAGAERHPRRERAGLGGAAARARGPRHRRPGDADRAHDPPAGPDVPGPRLAHAHRPARDEHRADPGPAASRRRLLVADRRTRARRRDDPGHPHRPRGPALPARRPSAAGGTSRAPRPHHRRRRALRGAGRGAEPAAGTRPAAPALGPVMIDDDVSVRRSLLQQDDTEVLRYTTTADEPSYLRLRSLNTFDGETFRSTAEGDALAMGMPAFSDARDDGVAAHGSA